MIRSAETTDAKKIAEIYNYYIENTCVTFEESVVSTKEIAGRIIETQQQGLAYLVAESDVGQVVGYAHASKWKGRCAYKYSVEVSVYLSNGEKSKGRGSQLYERLFKELKKKSVHVVIGGISLPNPGSIALHEKFGMKKVAHFEQVGFKFGHWVDVGYWQALLV